MKKHKKILITFLLIAVLITQPLINAAAADFWDSEVDAVGDFDAETDADGDLNDHADAAHDGAVGLEITFDDNNTAFGVTNALAVDQTSGVISLWLDKNDVAVEDGKQLYIASFHADGGGGGWSLLIINDGGTYKIRVNYPRDGLGTANGGTVDIPAGYNNYTLMFARSTGAGNDDGYLRVYVNDTEEINSSGHDNDTKDWDFARVGMTWTNSTTFSGSYYIDTIKIRTAIIPFVMADPSVVVSQDIQDEVQDALQADLPDEDADLWAITDIYTVGDYSMISIAGLDVVDFPDLPDPAEWLYYNAIWTGTAITRDNGDTTYTTGLAGDATYTTLLGESTFSNPYDGADQGGGGGNWIWFPWLAGTQGYYGVRGVHWASELTLPGWLAVDFVGGDNYGDTTMPNMVYGSWTEPIKNVCRDGTSVALTTANFYYVHLADSTSFQPGAMIRQGQPIGSLVKGSFNDNCGWAAQHDTSYHLHWGFKPGNGYLVVEGWTLNTSDEIWRMGDETVRTGQFLPASWPNHDGPIPTPGPTPTPGGPTPTPGDPPIIPRTYGGDSLWDPFVYGLFGMAETTADRFPEHEVSGIGGQITSGAEIAIRVAFTMLTSNFDLTITIIIFGLIAAAEVVRLIYALYLGVKKLIPILG